VEGVAPSPESSEASKSEPQTLEEVGRKIDGGCTMQTSIIGWSMMYIFGRSHLKLAHFPSSVSQSIQGPPGRECKAKEADS